MHEYQNSNDVWAGSLPRGLSVFRGLSSSQKTGEMRRYARLPPEDSRAQRPHL
jgi:hypothetical protein